ncbi:hypothetical protein [Gulosibacter bifidus]|uniref:Uncharacterized protein n=1 Tax=Gulosibacter bifidus TaxID=272239 RepID=A0ABW5RKI7_9MICO|nr:hypothetical protein [Gulosibacter bifidus]
MINAFDSSNYAKELLDLQQQMEEAQKQAFDSMREVIAYRLYGGAAAMWDDEEVVYVAVNEQGAPAEIRLAQDWDDEYTVAEVVEVVAVLARRLEAIRVERAKAHIADYPEDFEAITDAHVQEAFNDVQPGATVNLNDIEGEAIDASHRLTELQEEVSAAKAAGFDSLDEERPVSLIVMAGMLVGVRLNPEFINRSTTVQINAAIAEEISRVNSGEEVNDNSLASRLAATKSNAEALAATLRAQRMTGSNPFGNN